MHQALKRISEFNPVEQTVLVVTDAMRTISCLNNLHKQSEIEIRIRTLIEQLRDQGNTVDFCWVPAHGEDEIELNAEADQLAKEATENDEVSAELRHLKMPFSQVKATNRKNLNESWREFLPHLVSAWTANFARVRGLDRIAGFSTSQFISAHRMNNEYKHRFKLSNEADCPNCPSPIESPEHIFFVCPKYDRIRREHLLPNGLETKDDLIKLNNRQAADGFIAFCQEVVRLKIEFLNAVRPTD